MGIHGIESPPVVEPGSAGGPLAAAVAEASAVAAGEAAGEAVAVSEADGDAAGETVAVGAAGWGVGVAGPITFTVTVAELPGPEFDASTLFEVMVKVPAWTATHCAWIVQVPPADATPLVAVRECLCPFASAAPAWSWRAAQYAT